MPQYVTVYATHRYKRPRPGRACELDSGLELTMIGYGRIGYELRSRRWPEDDAKPLAGRLVAITGASSGIGRAATEMYLERGASVLGLVRNPENGERDSLGSAVEMMPCDLSSPASVRACAATLVASHRKLDVLVNNAGVLPPRRELTQDGIELSFATNVLGPFLLTALLVPVLSAAGGRIVNVSSAGMYTQRLHAEDLQLALGDYRGAVAYSRAKRAQVILSELWAKRLAPAGVAVHAMHPGWADTPGLARSLPRFRKALRPLLRTPEQGADTIVWLSWAPGLESGRFWQDRRARPTHLIPGTRERPGERERLWEECVRLTGAPQQP